MHSHEIMNGLMNLSSLRACCHVKLMSGPINLSSLRACAYMKFVSGQTNILETLVSHVFKC